MGVYWSREWKYTRSMITKTKNTNKSFKHKSWLMDDLVLGQSTLTNTNIQILTIQTNKHTNTHTQRVDS